MLEAMLMQAQLVISRPGYCDFHQIHWLDGVLEAFTASFQRQPPIEYIRDYWMLPRGPQLEGFLGASIPFVATVCSGRLPRKTRRQCRYCFACDSLKVSQCPLVIRDVPSPQPRPLLPLLGCPCPHPNRCCHCNDIRCRNSKTRLKPS
jgi:hypothetical protein